MEDGTGQWRLKLMICPVKNEKEAKFLGIWLDNRLNYHKQVREVKSKVSKANSLMTYLNKKSKGMELPSWKSYSTDVQKPC